MLNSLIAIVIVVVIC